MTNSLFNRKQKIMPLLLIAVAFICIFLFNPLTAKAGSMSMSDGVIRWTSSDTAGGRYHYYTQGYVFTVYKDGNNIYSGDYWDWEYDRSEHESDGIIYTDFSMNLDYLESYVGQSLKEGDIEVYANPIICVKDYDTVIYENLRTQQEVYDAFVAMCGGGWWVNEDNYNVNVDWHSFYLDVKCGTGISSTYGSGWYDRDTRAYFGGTASDGYTAPAENNIYMDGNKTVTVTGEANKYTVTYNGNGGKNAWDNETYSDNAYYGKWYQVMGESFIRQGYKFLGWSANGSTVDDWNGWSGTYNRADDLTLYAIWERIPSTLTVNHYVQNFDGTYTLQKSEKVEKYAFDEVTVALMVDQSIVVPDGIEFSTARYNGKTAPITITLPASSYGGTLSIDYTRVSHTLTVTPALGIQYVECNKYSWSDSEIQVSYKYGEMFSTDQIVKAGFEFDYWDMDGKVNTVSTMYGFMLTKDIHLTAYAKDVAPPTLEIRFDVNGNTNLDRYPVLYRDGSYGSNSSGIVGWYNKPIKLAVTATDAETYVKEVTVYNLDGSVNCVQAASGNQATVTLQNLYENVDTTYYADAVDIYGNRTGKVYFTLRSDTQKPVFSNDASETTSTLEQNSHNYYVDGESLFETARDSLSGMASLKFYPDMKNPDDSEYVETSSAPKILSIRKDIDITNPYRWICEATDVAGNKAIKYVYPSEALVKVIKTVISPENYD